MVRSEKLRGRRVADVGDSDVEARDCVGGRYGEEKGRDEADVQR